MFRSTIRPEPNQILLSELRSQFSKQCEPTLGVEVEVGLVDRVSEQPRKLFRDFVAASPKTIQPQLHPEFLASQVEFVTRPQEFIAGVAPELYEFDRSLTRFATRRDAKPNWKGNFPHWAFDESFVGDCERAQPLIDRLGMQTRQLAFNSTHFHVAVPQDQAIRVMDGLQLYLPLFVSLAANSPIVEGQLTGQKSHRVAVWSSGFAVCGLSEPYRNWTGFEQRMQKLTETGRIQVPKDLYTFVRPSRFGTIELRCCDLPANVEQVIALAALYQTLVVGLQHGVIGGRRGRDVLRAEVHSAYTDGIQARLLDHRDGLGSPLEWLQRLIYDLQPVAASLKTDAALALAQSVLESNGAEQQLAAWEQCPKQSSPRSRSARSRWEIGTVATAAGLSGLLAGFFGH